MNLYIKKSPMGSWGRQGFIHSIITLNASKFFSWGSSLFYIKQRTLNNPTFSISYRVNLKNSKKTKEIETANKYKSEEIAFEALKNKIIHACPNCLPHSINILKKYNETHVRCVSCGHVYVNSHKNKILKASSK